MDKIQRVTAIIEGRHADRPPISFWYHFGPAAAAEPRAVEAHVRHVETYDLDFLKIMDDNRYPRTAASGVISDVDDLDSFRVLRGDEDTFERQLELIGDLAKRFAGELLMTTTIFSPWSTLRQMTMPASSEHGPPTVAKTASPADITMSRLLRDDPDAVAGALEVIAESLANFASQSLAAGANGIFLSVNDEDFGAPEYGTALYDRLVRPGDLKILAGAEGGSFNMLHVCGKAQDFDRFAGYPVHVINWADRYAGPHIAEVTDSLNPAICAGLDNLGTMVTGSADDCAREVADALDQAGGRPIMIAPGCTYDPAAVSAENLHAVRRAVGA